jgi:hypothetical protein
MSAFHEKFELNLQCTYLLKIYIPNSVNKIYRLTIIKVRPPRRPWLRRWAEDDGTALLYRPAERMQALRLAVPGMEREGPRVLPRETPRQ